MTYSVGNPLSLLTDGMRGDPWSTPTFAPGSEVPEYDRDEFVVHAVYGGSVTLEVSGTGDSGWTEVWSPPKRATVVVTDRRIVLGCREFDRGSTYWGMGGVGVLVAVGATAVSRARARGRTAGHCLALQWPHAWVSAIGYLVGGSGWQGGLARLAGVPAERVVIVADQPGTQWRLCLGSPGEPAVRERAAAVASAIVRSRLARQDELAPPERAALRRLASTGVTLRSVPGQSAAVALPGARAVGWRPGALIPVADPVTAAPAPAPHRSTGTRRPAGGAVLRLRAVRRVRSADPAGAVRRLRSGNPRRPAVGGRRTAHRADDADADRTAAGSRWPSDVRRRVLRRVRPADSAGAVRCVRSADHGHGMTRQ